MKEESDEEDGDQLELQKKEPGSSDLFQSATSRSNIPHTITMDKNEGKQKIMMGFKHNLRGSNELLQGDESVVTG